MKLLFWSFPSNQDWDGEEFNSEVTVEGWAGVQAHLRLGSEPRKHSGATLSSVNELATFYKLLKFQAPIASNIFLPTNWQITPRAALECHCGNVEVGSPYKK